METQVEDLSTMGRPSKANERREEILDAFEILIRRQGLEGATLDQLAGHLGVRRGLIRHYLGNREDIVRALVDRIIQKAWDRMPTEWSGIPRDAIIRGILDELFEPPTEDEAHTYIVLKNLWLTHERDAQTKQLLQQLYQEYLKQIRLGLSQAFPAADPGRIASVAYGLMALAEGHDSLRGLEVGEDTTGGIRQVAERWIDSLSEED